MSVDVIATNNLDKPLFLQNGDRICVKYRQLIQDDDGTILHINDINIDPFDVSMPSKVDTVHVIKVKNEYGLKSGFGSIFGEKYE